MTEKPSLAQRILNLVGRPVPGRIADKFEVRATSTSPARSGGGGQLPEPGEMKVKASKGVGTGVPTVFATATPDTSSAINEQDRQSTNLDLTTLRNTGSTKSTIGVFAKVNPELSAAVDVYQRLGVTKRYKAIAYDRLTGEAHPDATRYLEQWFNYNDSIGDYTLGFLTNIPIPMLLAQLGQELRYHGSCACELVLNQQRQGLRIQPIGTLDIKWWPTNDRRTVPAQDINGERIDLDIPTFHYQSLDQSLYTPYSESPLEPAIQPVIMGLSFMNDVRRVIRAAVHPRLKITLNTEMVLKMMPAEALVDGEKGKEFRNELVAEVVDMINGLEPEEAFVFLDVCETEYMNRGNTSLGPEYQTIEGLSSGKISAGAKVLPSMIGRGQSQQVASTESMIFVKQVEGAHQAPLNSIMSRVSTQICRLAGHDVYVKFELDAINLRPEIELAAFRAQNQSSVLELLSLGIISDTEAAIELRGKLPGPSAPQLSGTMFQMAKPDNANPYSGTSGPGGDGAGGALNETLDSDAPKGKAGDNKKVTQ